MGPMATIRPDETVGIAAAEPAARPDPAALRSELRNLVATDPAAARELPARIASALWEGWRRDLESAGIGPAALSAAARGFRRELWLWVMGERTWAQTASALAGRAERRVA
jgi:hypothetical protein